MNVKIDFEFSTTDAAQIAEHLNACDSSFVQGLSRRVNIMEYSHKIAKNALRFEAWLEDRLVGLVAVYCNTPDKKVAFVTNVSVLSDLQGKGIGFQLMKNCITHVKLLDFFCLELEVEGSNVGARMLYEKLGFRTCSTASNTLIMTYNMGREI